MHYEELEDGSAVVSGVPIAPFVPLQHQQMNVAAIDMIANYTLRMARERGWLRTEREKARATDYYEGNDARPLVEQEGFAHHGDDLTIFYAGVEATLAELQPHFRYPPIPSTLLVSSHFFVSHVGTSSYGIYAELHAYLEGREATTRRLIGHFRITAVQVSRSLRTPHPLPADKREIHAQSCERSRAHLSQHAPEAVVRRLNARDILAASGVLACDATAADFGRLAIAMERCEGGDVFRTLYRLRETDLDFNLHVNQVATLTLVLNAFRRALRAAANGGNSNGSADANAPDGASACSPYRHLLNSGVLPMKGDLLLRRVRIDYLHEIPMAHEAVEVFLFPLNSDSTAKLAASKDGARLRELADIGFFCCGVPSVAPEGEQITSDRYLAVVGVLGCYV